MTRGWKPWEIDAAAEHTLNGLRDYLVRTGVFAAPAPAARKPRDGEDAVDIFAAPAPAARKPRDGEDAVDIFAGAEAGELRW